MLKVKPVRSSRQERLYAEVAANRKNCSFNNLVRLLEAYGFEERKKTRSGSSHVVFKRPGRNPISVPKAKPVKEHYVRDVLETIDELESEELS